MRKKSILFWLFLLILLSTYYFDYNKTKITKIFKLKNIVINGNENSNINLIEQKLKRFKDENIFFVDKKQVALSIIDIDFINNLKIKKIYPDKIHIQITEHEVIAKIQENGNKYLITKNGEVIKNFDKKFDLLPLVSGKNIEKKNFSQFYNFLKDLNFNIKNVQQFKYFESNRWDILLIDGKLIRLPRDQKRIENSVVKFISIIQDKKFNSFKLFDFRVKNQLIVK